MGELDGRVALVTGASRGIGAALALRLAAEGAAVALSARTAVAHDRLPGSLAESLEQIRSIGGQAIGITADLMSAEDRARLAQEAAERLGPVDVLINNAAASFYRPFLEWTEKRFQVAFEVNVRAAFDLAQRVVPAMCRSGRGWIVNVSSATARHPGAPPWNEFEKRGGDLLYGMTKAALDRFSRGLAAELFDAGVRVNSVAPVGAVETPGVAALGMVPAEALAAAEPMEVMVEAVLACCVAGAPTGRVLASVPFLEEIARPVRSLDGRRELGPVAPLVRG